MVQQLATDVYSRYAAFLNQIGVPFFFVKVTMVVHSVKKLRLWLFINMIGYNPFVLELVYV